LNGGGEAQCMTSYGESGQTVKVTVKINPEKTGFDQTPIVLTGVVA